MKRCLVLLLILVAWAAQAQEVLLPLRHSVITAAKTTEEAVLPFFDDFCTVSSYQRWLFAGTLLNQGFAPLPPTVGMATLDAYDENGCLYPPRADEMAQCDSLESVSIRLDSCFSPYPRKIMPQDSVVLSFYYLPGGGYGNMWERVGDMPEAYDSLVLQFYAPVEERWHTVWSHEGISADTLYARTGHYWQQVLVPIVDEAYLQRGFRFRFVNYAFVESTNKPGMLANSDQWNIDYVTLDIDRSLADTFYRDVAFVNPATSMLRSYYAMPARQFKSSEMVDTLSMTISNLFSEELACNYGFQVLDASGNLLHGYDGGFDNIPPYFPGMQYQTSAVHARPSMGYVLPVDASTSSEYVIVHNVREGVGGGSPLDSLRSANDTVSFRQVFDNYYAYDDGTPENGYGLTSTNYQVSLACRFALNVEDTLTAVALYFNRTMGEENASIPFRLTIWDDQDGHPGNILYQDSQVRKPQFAGLFQYVKYPLEQEVVCGGTIYVGFLQDNTDYINLGFDRNNDASSHILYLTSGTWQTSILRGALMLRPYFGQEALAGISTMPEESYRVVVSNRSIRVENAGDRPVQVYDVMGRQVRPENLSRGIYLVRVGVSPAKKVVIY